MDNGSMMKPTPVKPTSSNPMGNKDFYDETLGRINSIYTKIISSKSRLMAKMSFLYGAAPPAPRQPEKEQKDSGAWATNVIQKLDVIEAELEHLLVLVDEL